MKQIPLFLLMFCNSIYAGQELTIWHDKYQATPLFEQITNDFQSETGIQLKVHYMPTSVLKLTALKKSHTSTAPDILIAPSDFIGNRSALSLSKVPEELNNESLLLAKASVTDDGKQFGIPLLFGNHLLLYYNKQLVPEPARNWTQLLEQKPLLESKGASVINWKTGEMYWVIPFLTAFGKSPVDVDTIHFDNKEIQHGLELLKKQAEVFGIDSGCDYSCVYQDFVDGKVAYSINGDWAYQSLSTEMAEDLGVSLMPEVNGQPMHSFYSSIALLFPNHSLTSKKQQAINEFIQYIRNDENQLLLYQYVGMMPATTVAYDLVVKQQEDIQNFRVLLEQLNRSILMPPNRAMSAAWQGMAKGVSLYMSGKVSSEKAIQLMQKHSLRELNRLSETTE
ncbi:extracellular solute-binding protein [Vibrio hannami]|uniref:sugar ABC transporter substrate-binding protein n=1 Tax=Vibrio hannami TaxID=2717094 RepID=UPI00240EDA12|nr:extracellular solute-binding protein [Vibrio hannami]MDG3086533.1 extracellular solute-binding protein [Vibrio hannami]